MDAARRRVSAAAAHASRVRRGVAGRSDARATEHLPRWRRSASAFAWASVRPMTLDELNALSPEQASEIFRSCCGASRWVDAMVARRPFASTDTVVSMADDIWLAMGPDDWREA